MKLGKLTFSGKNLVLGLLISLVAVPAHTEDDFSPFVSKDGDISFPEGFRSSMVHLGSWFVPFTMFIPKKNQ